MIRIWELILHGCWHRWGRPMGTPCEHYDTSWGGKSYMYTTMGCRCEKCGRHKRVRID